LPKTAWQTGGTRGRNPVASQEFAAEAALTLLEDAAMSAQPNRNVLEIRPGGTAGTAAGPKLLKTPIVKRAEDLESLARRINAREKKSRKDTLQHARQQGEDLLAAKAKCEPRKWQQWREENITAFGKMQATRYMRFAKSNVTLLSEDQQWDEWQRISGNAQAEEDEQGEEEPKPKPPSAPAAQAAEEESTGEQEETEGEPAAEEGQEEDDNDDDQDQALSQKLNELGGPAPKPLERTHEGRKVGTVMVPVKEAAAWDARFKRYKKKWGVGTIQEAVRRAFMTHPDGEG
jgi:hypothetical protein